MNTKSCSRCKEIKLLTEFNSNKTKKDGLQLFCKLCTKIYNQKWYIKNSLVVKNRTKESKKQTKAWFIEYKKTLKCSRCPENYPACLDFHHTNNDKEIGISKAVQSCWSKKKILKEISKCIILCANCHRKEHY